MKVGPYHLVEIGLKVKQVVHFQILELAVAVSVVAGREFHVAHVPQELSPRFHALLAEDDQPVNELRHRQLQRRLPVPPDLFHYELLLQLGLRLDRRGSQFFPCLAGTLELFLGPLCDDFAEGWLARVELLALVGISQLASLGEYLVEVLGVRRDQVLEVIEGKRLLEAVEEGLAVCEGDFVGLEQRLIQERVHLLGGDLAVVGGSARVLSFFGVLDFASGQELKRILQRVVVIVDHLDLDVLVLGFDLLQCLAKFLVSVGFLFACDEVSLVELGLRLILRLLNWIGILERLPKVNQPMTLLPPHISHQPRSLSLRRERHHLWPRVSPCTRNPRCIIRHNHLSRRRSEQLRELLEVNLLVKFRIFQLVDESADQVLLNFLRGYRLLVVLDNESVDTCGVNLLLTTGELLIQQVILAEVC